MIWLIPISLLLLFILWLLFVPVRIFTNTDRNRYLLTLPGIFRVVLVPDKGLFYFRIWVCFIPFRFNLFKRKKEKGKNKPAAKKLKLWRTGKIQMITGALSAFRIRRLEADIDTNDFTLNAWLVPVFSMINGETIRLQVNFEGRHSLLLDLRITLGTMLWILIKTKYKSIINH